jgi:Zn-dependent protease
MFYYDIVLRANYYAVLVFSYMILVTLVGYCRAQICSWLSDDTARDQGFLTLNPAMHVDLFGMMLLIFVGVGWGRQIPINPANFYGRFRWLRLFIALMSGVISYAFIAIVGLLGLAYMSGSTLTIHAIDPAGFSVPSILARFIIICIFLATIELVINAVTLVTLFIVDKYEDLAQYAFYAVLIVPILIFLIYGQEITNILIHGIVCLASCIAQLIGRI